MENKYKKRATLRKLIIRGDKLRIKLLISGIILGFILLVSAGGYFIKEVVSDFEEREQLAEEIEDKEESRKILYEKVKKNEAFLKVENLFPLETSESELQNYIHWLSHQKVSAFLKWGEIQITPDRIDRLIKVVEANDYEHEKVYLNILYAWKANDFSQADKEHNLIWKLQGGTVGEATGLLTEEEEQAFINVHFE
jgi:hypothetical protein